MKCAIDGCEAEARMTPRIKHGPANWSTYLERSVCSAHMGQTAGLFETELADAAANETELCLQMVPVRVAQRAT
jgi:hypothetical protein